MRALIAFPILPILLVASCDSGSRAEGEGEGGPTPDEPCPDCADCAECIDEKCFDLVDRCSDCGCVLDCIGENGLTNVDFCIIDACGLSERPAGFTNVEQCLAYSCPDVDECNVPADYVPPDNAVLETTDEIGDGALADCSFDDALVFDPFGTVVQLESAGGDVCVRIDRTNDGPGEQENTAFSLTSLRAGPLGLVSEASDLCFYASHHNFGDWAHAWTGTRRYDVELEEFGHEGLREYTLYTFDQGPLDETSCGPEPGTAGAIGQPLKLFPVNP